MQVTKKRVKDFYENLADKYDAVRFESLKDYVINILQLEAVRSMLRNKSHISLDVGCGSGRITSILTNNSEMTVGLDANVSMLHFARSSAKSVMHACMQGCFL